MSDIVERPRIIELAEERGEFITGDDGFVYYWPDNKRGGGAYSSHDLRTLADELDKRNASWQIQIEEYFEGQSNT